MNRKAAIISIQGSKLTASEIKLLKKEKPWGIILFKRNIIKTKLNDIQHEAEILDGNGLTNFTKDFKSFDVLYPSIGENFSLLKRLVKNRKFLDYYLGRIYKT